MSTAIDNKYAEVIQVYPWIGNPTGDESVCTDGRGHFRHYEGGASILWTPETGAHLVYGLIRDKWAALDWERSPLGYPTTDEADAGSGLGRYNDFQGGTILWKRDNNEAFAIYGDIYGKWCEQGVDTGFLGFPITDECGTPDGIGRYNHFDGGSIYWTPETGAHMIYGLIRDKWAALGWETSPLGYPTTDEADAQGGRYNDFQYGTIIWKRGTNEAFAVYGDIGAKWVEQGKWGEQGWWDTGSLGFPLTDESGTSDGIGRYNTFDGGSIHWTPETGAHITKGPIREAWAAQGWEVSRLQYPTTDELVTDGTNGLGRYNCFEGGEILWTPQSGTVINLYPTKSILRECDRNLQVGDVIASQIWVKLWNDGNWQFHAFVHSDASVIGDTYAIGFVIEGCGRAATISDHIDAGDDQDKTVGGTDPWIEQFWHKVDRSVIHFKMRGQGDNPLGLLWDALKEYGPELIALVAA